MTRTQQSAPMQGQGSVGGIGMGMALDNNAGQGQGQGQHPFMQQQSMSVGGSRAGYGNGQQGTSQHVTFPFYAHFILVCLHDQTYSPVTRITIAMKDCHDIFTFCSSEDKLYRTMH